MKMRISRILSSFLLLSLPLAGGGCSSAPEYDLIQGYAQGGTYSVRYCTRGVSRDPRAVREAVDSILTLVDTTLSGYNKGSLLSRYNAGVEVVPNALLLDATTMGRAFFEETGGALDVASGPLFDAWGFGFKNGSMPSAEAVDSIRAICGMDKVGDDLRSTVEGVHPVLNFNAVAQGYTCDLVAGYLHSIGVHDMLVDIGEIYCEGVNPKGNFWKVGVDRPVDGNMTPGQDLDGIWQGSGRGCGIVTSGNYRKFYEKDGKKYSHTIDPRTGYPVDHSLLSATIVAPTAAAADAYATYCMVVGLAEAQAFLSSRDDLEGYLIYDEGGEMKEWASAGFNIVSEGH